MALGLGKKVFQTILVDLKCSAPLLSSVFSSNSKRFDSTYKAAVLTEYGKPITFDDKKRKKLKKGDVRVKVHHAGINMSDSMLVNGEYPEVGAKLPGFVPGYEVTGAVLEVSDVSDFAVGDRVVGLSKTEFGGFAEECVLGAKDVWLLPSTITYSRGAALVDGYSTALIGLSRLGHIKESDKLLVTCSAGGLGLAAVDIAANLYRAKVIGVCDTEDKAELLRNKGAWAALGNDPKHVLQKVKEVTEGRGVRIAFDAVGWPTCEHVIKCVAHEGMLIVAGAAVRKVPSLPTSLLLPNAVSLVAVSLRNYRLNNNVVYRRVVQDAIDMCEQGLVSPFVAKEFKFVELNEAMQFVAERKSTGKVIVDMSD